MVYKYQSEDENCYHMAHPDGSSFRVAKHGISESVKKQIEAMKPQEFAQGGIVEDPAKRLEEALKFDATAPLPAEVKPNPASGAIESLALGAETAALDKTRIEEERVARIAAEAAAQTAKEEAKTKGALRLESTPGALQAEAQAQPGVGDVALKEQQDAIDALNARMAEQQTAQGQAVAGTPQSQLLGQMQGLSARAESAYNQIGKSQEAAFQEQARIYDEQAKQMAEVAAKYEEQFSKLQADRERIMKEVEEGKIEPNRMFNTMSDGNKAMMAIGLVLSSIGSAQRGVQNDGLMLLDRMVTRDIEAQKANMGKKQTLLSQNMQMTNDLRQAEAMTRLQMGAAIEARVKQVAAQSGSEQAKANAQLALVKIQAELLPVQQRLAQSAAVQAMPKSALAQQINALPDEVKKDAYKELGELRKIEANISQVPKIMKEAASYTTLKSKATSPIQSKSLQEITFAKLFPIAKAISGERMTDADARLLVTPYLPSFYDNESTINTKINSLMEALQSQAQGRTPILQEYGVVAPTYSAEQLGGKKR